MKSVEAEMVGENVSRKPALPARQPPSQTNPEWEELSNWYLTVGRHGQFELMCHLKYLHNSKPSCSYEEDLLQLSDGLLLCEPWLFSRSFPFCLGQVYCNLLFACHP